MFTFLTVKTMRMNIGGFDIVHYVNFDGCIVIKSASLRGFYTILGMTS